MKINTNPYPVTLEIVNDTRVFIRKYKKLKGYVPDLSIDTMGISSNHGNSALIGVFNGDIITLTHELNHFCLWTFDYVGMPVNTIHSEAYCYYYDHILKQVLPSYLTAYRE